MGQLRRKLPALRSRDFFYFNVQSRPGQGLVVFQRRAPAAAGRPEQIALVVLNFSDSDGMLTLPAPRAGTYREMVDRLNRKADFDVVAASAGGKLGLNVPSNYGQIYVTPPPAVGV